MPIIVKKKIRLHNPQSKAKSRPKAKTARAGSAKRSTQQKRSNPAHLMTLGSLNPQKKRTTTMKKKRSAPETARKSKTAPRKKNPFFASSKRSAAKQGSRRRRNPARAGLLRPMDLAKSGVTALVGLVATRQIPQIILQGRNTGWIGYLANLVTAGASAALANKFIGPEAGKLVFIGGGVYTVSRILTEQLSPVGKWFSLTGLGDAQAAGLGQIRNGYFPVPVVTDNRGNPHIPQAIVEAVKAQLPAPAPQPNRNLSGLGRFAR